MQTYEVIEALDPQLAHHALLCAAVTVSVTAGLQERFIRRALVR